jgi:hypothetical protein
VTVTWVGSYLGLVIGKEETAAQASILVFPLTMVSVLTAGMPAWLRAIADWNPVSALLLAVFVPLATARYAALPSRSAPGASGSATTGASAV